MGIRSVETFRSDGSGCLYSPVTASAASRQSRSSAGAQPVGALPKSGQVASSVHVRKASPARSLISRIFLQIDVGQDRLRHFEPVVLADLMAEAGSAAGQSSTPAT